MHFARRRLCPLRGDCAGKRYSARGARGAVQGRASRISSTPASRYAASLRAPSRCAASSRTLVEDRPPGTLKIGPSAPTMSSGEAQRVKLSRGSARARRGRTLYVLDEPTTGLQYRGHPQAARRASTGLVEARNTVVVIEHGLDVIECADWVIDPRPREGRRRRRPGHRRGTPEHVAKVKELVHGTVPAALFSA